MSKGKRKVLEYIPHDKPEVPVLGDLWMDGDVLKMWNGDRWLNSKGVEV